MGLWHEFKAECSSRLPPRYAALVLSGKFDIVIVGSALWTLFFWSLLLPYGAWFCENSIRVRQALSETSWCQLSTSDVHELVATSEAQDAATSSRETVPPAPPLRLPRAVP